MKGILKKLKDNKKIALGILLVVIIIVIALVVILSTKDNAKLTCTKDIEYVDGINLEEELVIKIKKKKIKRIQIDKTILLDGYYQKFDAFRDIIDRHINGSYKYLDEKDYKITKEDDKINIKVDTKKNGVVLNNLNITKKEGGTKDDLSINSSNVLESSTSAIKIDDEYDQKEIKKIIEGYGYKCKK